MDQEKADELFWWICDGAPPSGDWRAIVTGVCEKLNELGAGVDRFALFLFTIHPTIKGRRLTWSPDEGVQAAMADAALFMSDEFTHNPLPLVAKTKTTMRRKLEDPDCPHDYIIVDELIEQGFTDYLAQPLPYTDGDVHTMSWSSKQPGGFSDEILELLERIRRPMARITESYVLRLNASFLLSTYVGRNAGARILSGHIDRGDFEDIEAGILFADLKNFTGLSNEKNSSQLLEILNQFFGHLEQPIREHGGEILKFMGDGLLAIFPVKPGERDLPRAVKDAATALTAASSQLADDESFPYGFRAAIHCGPIQYGNIGGERRLDFTAIGPAVNLTARLLSHATNIGSDFVCSTDGAVHLDELAGEQIEFTAKGFDEKQLICPLKIG